MQRRTKQHAATAGNKPHMGNVKRQGRKGAHDTPRPAASEARKAATVQDTVDFADSLQGILSYHNTHYKSNNQTDSVLAAARAATLDTNAAAATAGQAELPGTVEEVMAMNAQAMEAIRAGQLDVGHDILTRVLHAAEQKLQQMPALLSPPDAANEGNDGQLAETAAAAQVRAFNEWLAAYSVTLSNLGCQLHRDGKVADALRCLQDARDVETHLYRTPSCSTMLNLSAVLLSAGDVVAALQIAQECVVAAQDADPVLFITALHNLAITLGQQGTARERQAALPTMLRALREAQANLGEQDPTTLMLKERCGSASRWIAAAPRATTETLQRSATGSGRALGRLGRVAPHAQTLPEETQQRSRRRSMQSRGSVTSLASSSRRLGRSASRRGPSMQSSARTNAAGRADGTSAERFALPSIIRAPSRQASGRSVLTVGQANKEHDDVPLQQRARQAIETLDLGPATSLALQARPQREARSVNKSAAALVPAAQEGSTTARGDGAQAAQQAVQSDEGKGTRIADTTQAAPDAVMTSTQGHPAVMNEAQGTSGVTLPPLVTNAPQVSSTSASPLQPGKNSGSPQSLRQQQQPPLPQQQQQRRNDDTSIAGDKADAAVSLPLLARSTPRLTPDEQRMSGSKNSGSSSSTASRTSHKYAAGGEEAGRTMPVAVAVQAPVNRLAHIVSPGAKAAPPPSFLRFVEADVAAAAPLPHTVPHASYQEMYAHLQRDAQAAAALREPHSAPGGDGEEGGGAAGRTETTPHGGKAKTTSPARQGLFRPSSRDREAEKERVRHAEAEYRLRREAAQRVAHEEQCWQAALQQIQLRTQNRAARVIQTVWRLWWAAVGRPRWVAQQELQEQRMRRLRERRIRDALRFEPRQRRTTVLCAGFAPPALVVRCGRRWLERTACVRYLAREHLLKPRRTRKGHAAAGGAYAMWAEDRTRSSEGDDATAAEKTRYEEATVRQLVVRLQAVWRGACTRRRYAARRSRGGSSDDAASAGGGGVVGPDAAQRLAEERCYAAMVLQRAVRCMQARTRRATLLRDKLTPFALRIQRWYRHTLAEQRRRGVDRVTVQRRNDAARCVQCAWRAYQARLRLYMLRLRRSMQACGDAAERMVAEVPQRKMLAIMPAVDNESAQHDECAREGQTSEHECAMQEQQAGSSQEAMQYTAYQEECLRRAPAVLQERQREREEYDVALYYAPRAEQERQAWAEALRLRPFEVETRRANEEWHCELEQNTFRRGRAARCIQRAFRCWRRMRHDGYRDRTLLQHSRDVYRHAEYESVVIRRQYEKVQRRGRELYGDQAEPVRSSRALAEAEMRALEATMPVSLSPSETSRGRRERAAVEKELQRDELLLRLTYPDDLARLRSDPVVEKEATGRMYEHPYYKMYHNETHKQVLGIDT